MCLQDACKVPFSPGNCSEYLLGAHTPALKRTEPITAHPDHQNTLQPLTALCQLLYFPLSREIRQISSSLEHFCCRTAQSALAGQHLLPLLQALAAGQDLHQNCWSSVIM